MGPISRLRFFFTRRPSRDLDEELRFHLDQATDAYRAAGITPEEARRRARVDFGGVERAREESARQHPAWLLSTVAQDIRYALRGFRRNPLFALTVIATLALAIGASTAVFSVVDRILFRPLPYAHADRLVSLGMRHAAEPYEFMMGEFFYDWRDRQTAFTNITAQDVMSYPCDLTGGDSIERGSIQMSCIRAHADLLPTLGVAPLLGRGFQPGDMLPSAPRTVLLSYALWQSRYHRDPAILGQLIQIDDAPARVIGVLPPEFEMPAGQPADVLLPKQIDAVAVRSGKQHENMRAFARLKPGVSIAQARAALQPLFESSLSFAPAFMRKDVHLELRSLRDRQMHDLIPAAWIMLAAVVAVLLIACANVAGLLLTRNTARERELAVRAALGAGRARLALQTLTESLLLSLLGGIAGCLLAQALLRIFLALAPAGMPFLKKATLDLRVLIAALAFSLFSGIVCGLLPALHRPRAIALAARAPRAAAQATLRRALVVTQIACSVLLLSAATLFLRSFRNIEEQSLGVETGGVLTAGVVLPVRSYNSPRGPLEFFTRATAALRSLPGISAVAVSNALPPLSPRSHWYADISIAGRQPTVTANGGTVSVSSVTPGYFEALDIPILRGRGFTDGDADSQQNLLILSNQLAARLFPREDPIGQRLRLDADGPYYSVIGVAANVRNGGLTGANLPAYYQLLRNTPEDWNNDGVKILMLRSALPAATIAPSVRQQLAAIAPTVPVDIQTLDEHIHTLAARPRFETALLGFFALTGLLMAVIGLYGVTAYAAAQRTQEMGVRIALGATRANILGLIAWEGARLIVLGGALGLACALATAHLLRSLLFSVGPYDPLSFLAAAALLGIVALAAILTPARAAMRLDPVSALRCD